MDASFILAPHLPTVYPLTAHSRRPLWRGVMRTLPLRRGLRGQVGRRGSGPGLVIITGLILSQIPPSPLVTDLASNTVPIAIDPSRVASNNQEATGADLVTVVGGGRRRDADSRKGRVAVLPWDRGRGSEDLTYRGSGTPHLNAPYTRA